MNTKALRQKVLDLAIHGKLVPQNPNDESATVLLEKIRAEKAEKIKKGELKADKKDSFIFVGSDKRHYEQFADGTVKDIEDEIPFDVPEGWAWCRLKQLSLDMADGPFGSNLKAEHYTKNKEARIIQLSNIGEYGWREENTKYTTLEHAKNNISRSIVEPGNVVIAKMMPAGRAIICPNNEKMYVLSSDAVKLVPTSLINSNYLLNAINSSFFRASVTDNVQGTTRLRTSISKLRDCFFPLPPLNEQVLIVNAIENAISQIDVLEHNKIDLQNLITQIKSKILDLAIHGKLVPQVPNDEPAEELLKRIATSDNRPYKKFDDDITFSLPKNWEWCYLGDICKVSSAKRVLQQDWKDSGIPFYRAREIAQLSNNENVKDDLFITPELYDELKNKYGVPVSGDLMISAVGTIGKVYIVKESDCFYYKDASVICFSKKEKSIDSKYLKLCLESGFLQNQIYSQSTGTTVDTITINKAQEYLFPLPNIKEQQRIVSKIDELFSYLDTISSNLE